MTLGKGGCTYAGPGIQTEALESMAWNADNATTHMSRMCVACFRELIAIGWRASVMYQGLDRSSLGQPPSILSILTARYHLLEDVQTCTNTDGCPCPSHEATPSSAGTKSKRATQRQGRSFGCKMTARQLSDLLCALFLSSPNFCCFIYTHDI